VALVIWLVTIGLVIRGFWRVRRQRWRGGVGTAAVGSMYGWLNEDKRNAVEVIVEERAAARDPEDKDGNLPDLAGPRQSRMARPHS
jgi:hypothetical protein